MLTKFVKIVYLSYLNKHEEMRYTVEDTVSLKKYAEYVSLA